MRAASPPRRLPRPPVITSGTSTVDLSNLHEETEMLKFTSEKTSKPLLRMFYVTENNLYLKWNSNWWAMKNKDQKQIDLRTVRRVQQGHLSARFEAVKHNFEGTARRSFSVVYGEDLRTLDIIADTDEKFHVWYGGLKQIVRDLSDTRDSSKVDQLYLKSKFDLADVDEDGALSKDEVMGLLSSLHVNMSRRAVDALFGRADKDGNGELDRDEFAYFVQMLRRRHDLEYLWHKIVNNHISTAPGIESCEPFELVVLQDPTESLISQRSLNSTVSSSDFLSFWNCTQGSANTLTLAQAEAMISEAMPGGDGWLSYGGFLKIMTSPANNVYDPEAVKLKPGDLSYPLSYYYIATSHNTYLSGDQLTGISSVDRYVDVLEKGCRCVELDIWDGAVDIEDRRDGVASFVQPVITHGGTLTTSITFADVLEGIREHAFETSSMPVILSFENHCCQEQQKVMAEALIHIFGNNGLLLEPDMNNKVHALPSPEELRNKIIIKGKRKNFLFHGESESALAAASFDAAEDGEDEDNDDTPRLRPAASNFTVETSVSSIATSHQGKKAKVKQVTHPDLAAITYLGASHAPKSFSAESSNAIPCDMMSSYSETKTLKHLAKPQTVEEWINHNRNHMSRIYPAGTRVNSSNLEPTGPWAAGNHMVALNYQTEDTSMFLNHGLFLQNEQCGYVLKPEYMINPTVAPMGSIGLNIHVIGASQLPKAASFSGKGETLTPFVRATLFGIGNDNADFRTKSVKDNGFNPIWDEVSYFGVERPECAHVMFRVFNGASDREDFIAFSSIPVVNLVEGFRTVTLYDKHGSRQGDVLHASLSVRISKVAKPTLLYNKE